MALKIGKVVLITLGLSLAAHVPPALSDPYYTGNPYTPYPPGCVTMLQKQSELYGDNVYRFFSGEVSLEVVHKIASDIPSKNQGKARINLYRLGCAEPNRSVIMVEFTLLSEWVDPRLAQLVLPEFYGKLFDWGVPFTLRAEPNSWAHSIQQASLTKPTFGDYTNGWDEPRRFVWRYVLDVTPTITWFDAGDLAYEYNTAFELEIYRDRELALTIAVPSTKSVLTPNPSLPLNGRLSGNWVERGAADQGFLLSFSTLVPGSGADSGDPVGRDLVVFLSWFTFDAGGKQLWLTGSARFPQGSADVEIPIERVTNGDFMGSRRADRDQVGTAHLSAIRCNGLQVDYELGGLGLASGVMHLERLYSLEIAGYACRDHWARVATVGSGD